MSTPRCPKHGEEFDIIYPKVDRYYRLIKFQCGCLMYKNGAFQDKDHFNEEVRE